MGAASCEHSCSSPSSFPSPLPGPLPRIAGVSDSLRLYWVGLPPPQQQPLLLVKQPPSPAFLDLDSSLTTEDCLALDFLVGIQNQQLLHLPQQLQRQPQLQQQPPQLQLLQLPQLLL